MATPTRALSASLAAALALAGAALLAALVGLGACGPNVCTSCAGGLECVDGRCLQGCRDPSDCPADTTCFLGYCEQNDPAPGSGCGNGVLEAGEACDGAAVGSSSDCTDFGYSTAGPVGCLPTCMAYDLASCQGVDGTCGNGRRRQNEQCDGGDLSGESCVSLGYAGGALGCNDNCSFDVAGCLSE